jgi:hypothetical protein
VLAQRAVQRLQSRHQGCRKGRPGGVNQQSTWGGGAGGMRQGCVTVQRPGWLLAGGGTAMKGSGRVIGRVWRHVLLMADTRLRRRHAAAPGGHSGQGQSRRLGQRQRSLLRLRQRATLGDRPSGGPACTTAAEGQQGRALRSRSSNPWLPEWLVPASGGRGGGCGL